MKQFSCGDIVPGCGDVLQAADEPQLLSLAHAHAVDHHDMDELPTDLIDAVRRSIVTV